MPVDLNELQRVLFEEYKKNGYLAMWSFDDMEVGTQKIADLGEVGLFISEVAEVQEEIRNKNTDLNHVGEECADIIIRVLNFMSRKGLNVEKSIIEKNKKNLERGKLHGRGV